MEEVSNYSFGISGGEEQGRAFGQAAAKEQEAALEKTRQTAQESAKDAEGGIMDRLKEAFGATGGTGAMLGGLLGGGQGLGTMGGMVGGAVAGPVGGMVGGQLAQVVGQEISKVTNAAQTWFELNVVNPLEVSITGLRTNGEEVVRALDEMPPWLSKLVVTAEQMEQALAKINAREDAKSRKQALFSSVDAVVAKTRRMDGESEEAYAQRVLRQGHYQRKRAFEDVEEHRIVMEYLRTEKGIGGIKDKTGRYSSQQDYVEDQDRRIKAMQESGFGSY